jgi:hypothetical protein
MQKMAANVTFHLKGEFHGKNHVAGLETSERESVIFEADRPENNWIPRSGTLDVVNCHHGYGFG